MKENQNRRTFLRDTLLIGTGVTVGALLPNVFRGSSRQMALADDKEAAGSAEQRLKDERKDVLQRYHYVASP